MTREELKSADTRSLISALQYCGCDSYYATYYDEVVDEITKRLNRIAELEKENAELKAVERMALYSKMSDQLAKAKKIIKDLCGMVRELNKPNVQLTNIDYSLSEAKQFLSEVENGKR